MRLSLWLTLSGTVLLAGCHSRYIQATIVNVSSAPLHVVQVEYPSASFGTQDLAPGQTFRYRFKIMGSGPVKLTFTDAGMHDHQQSGPVLHEGDEGQLQIRFSGQDHADFQLAVHPR